jgi:hypothetical protein
MPGEGSWVGGFPGVPLGGATFTRRALPDGTRETVWLDGGKNPPNGVQLIYRLPSDADDVSLTIRDADGTVLRTFGSTSPADRDLSADQLTPRTSGTHAFVWDLRIEPALAASTDGSPRGVVYPGPRVAPGRYTVTLGALGATAEQTVVVERDPRGIATDEDLAEQHRLLVRIRDLLQRVADGIGWATSTHASLEALRTRLGGRPLAERIGTVADRIDALLRVLTNPDMKDHNDALKMAAGLEQKIVLLPEIVVELSDTRPVQGVYAVLDRFEAEADDALAGLDDIRQDAIPELDSALRADTDIALIAPAE